MGLSSCIEQAQWTWPGDIRSDAAAPDDTPEVAEPKDTTETVEPKDTIDTLAPDVCIPECNEKNCGDDGCGGTCGECTGGTWCEGLETCQEGVCVQGQAPDCDDGNPCTEDGCDVEAPKCTHILKDLDDLVVEDCLCDTDEDCEPLEDGNLCNGTLVCDLEAETPTCKVDDPTVVVCDELPDGAHTDCNVPVCDPDTGACLAVAANEGLGCEDGDLCTEGEVCVEGLCADGVQKSCDDANECTDDVCTAGVGCEYGPGGEGEPCDGGDGVCVAGICCIPDCDGKECGDDGCGGVCGSCGDSVECVDGLCQPLCGNGLCVDAGENCSTCVADCGCDPDLEACIQVTTGEWVCAAKLVEIPAGTFWMGCNNCPGSTVQDPYCEDREHPYHEVHLDTYYLDRTEVTADQYAVCVVAGPCSAAGTADGLCTWQEADKGEHPINCVTWSQAYEYCQWAGKRLPTEAEWEKGARGGCELNGGANCEAASRMYPWGNDPPTCDHAVRSMCGDDTEPVCSKSPLGDSPYGLCDMAGNVGEWVGDWYGSDYYCAGEGADTEDPWTYCPACDPWPGSPAAWLDPQGPSSGSRRSARGGSLYNNYVNIRVSNRGQGLLTSADGDLGFRCARSDCGDGICDGAVGEDCSNCIQDCGCVAGDACFDGTCCTPQCDGAACGDDGCGGNCGECDAGETCQEPWRVCVPPQHVVVPPGWFVMGSPDDVPCSNALEKPQHQVTITRPLLVSDHEVTQGEWEAVTGADNPAAYGPNGPEPSCSLSTCPLERVAWYEAIAYLNLLSLQDGLTPCYDLGVGCTGTLGTGCEVTEWNCLSDDYLCPTVAFEGLDCEGWRLPTEAEWEYVARAGTKTAHAFPTPNGGPRNPHCQYFMDDPAVEDAAWWPGNVGHPMSVRTKDPNNWGLYDTAGNVYEMVWGRGGYYYTTEPEIDPLHDDSEYGWVIRGGSFSGDLWYEVRSAFRWAIGAENQRHREYGFRAVRTLPGIACEPDCTGMECGDGGCGWTCGWCRPGYECDGGACQPDCAALCQDLECGPSGVDEECDCGTCPGGYHCSHGLCALDGMVAVPSGSFMMGCLPYEDPGCDVDEYQYHEVVLDAYEIDASEVTVGAYQLCVDALACEEAGTTPVACTADDGVGVRPVNCISWLDADEYCQWAGRRLCTEAEWEKAARGLDARIYPWGYDDPTCSLGAIEGCGLVGPLPVTSKPTGVSYYGVHDMSGNVAEWVGDWYAGDYYCNGSGAICQSGPCDTCLALPPFMEPWPNPEGPPAGTHRVHRGGAYSTQDDVVYRVANRIAAEPDFSSSYIGIRCCRDHE